MAVCLRERQGFSAEDIDDGVLFGGEIAGEIYLADVLNAGVIFKLMGAE